MTFVHNMVMEAILWLKNHLEHYIITWCPCRYAKYAKSNMNPNLPTVVYSVGVSTHVSTWFSVKTLPKPQTREQIFSSGLAILEGQKKLRWMLFFLLAIVTKIHLLTI
jgi:hypothetical protein